MKMFKFFVIRSNGVLCLFSDVDGRLAELIRDERGEMRVNSTHKEWVEKGFDKLVNSEKGIEIIFEYKLNAVMFYVIYDCRAI